MDGQLSNTIITSLWQRHREDDNANSWNILADKVLPMLFAGDFSQCNELLMQCNQQASVLVQLTIAENHYWLGNFDQAQAAYKAALALQPGALEAKAALLGQARCHNRAYDFTLAEQALGQVCARQRLDENSPDVEILAACELALCYAWQQRIPEARLMFESELSLDDFQSPYKRTHILSKRGMVRFYAGSHEAASNDLQEAVQLPVPLSEKLDALLTLGDIDSQMGNLEYAQHWYQQVLSWPQTFLAQEAQAKLTRIKASASQPLVPVAEVPANMSGQVEEVSTTEDTAVDIKTLDSEPIDIEAAEASTPECVPALSDAETEADRHSADEKPAPAVAPAAEPVQTEPVVALENADATEPEPAEAVWCQLPFSAILLGLETLEMQSRQKK